MSIFVSGNRVIDGLEVIKKSLEQPREPLYKNRELLDIIYEETYVITIHKLIGTDNIIIAYTETGFSVENDFNPISKIYIVPESDYKKFYPDIFAAVQANLS